MGELSIQVRQPIRGIDDDPSFIVIDFNDNRGHEGNMYQLVVVVVDDFDQVLGCRGIDGANPAPKGALDIQDLEIDDGKNGGHGIGIFIRENGIPDKFESLANGIDIFEFKYTRPVDIANVFDIFIDLMLFRY